MWEKEVVLPANQAPVTLKEQLLLWHVPRRLRGRLRQQRRVLLNGHYQPTSTNLQPGDVITMHFEQADFAPESAYVPDDRVVLPVLFETADFLVINKPKGMKSHPNSPGEDGTVMNFVEAYLQPQGQHAYMVHRLDSETTGAMLVGKKPYVVPILNELLREKEIKRTYLAWVTGALTSNAGTIDLPIGEDPVHDRLRQVNGPNARLAVTHWQKIHQVYQNTLVRIELETGRTHQIRVHFAAIGHPLIGDALYNPQATPDIGLMLHAASIRVPMPFEGTVRSISAPLPRSFPRNLT